jgi:hypothetical protein
VARCFPQSCLAPGPHVRLGTIDYLSPEILDCPVKAHPNEFKTNPEKYYTNKVDCWSVGVLAYELLTGRTPFEAVRRPGRAAASTCCCWRTTGHRCLRALPPALLRRAASWPSCPAPLTPRRAPPAAQKTPPETLLKIKTQEVAYPPGLSPGARDFMARALVRDPARRATMAELLAHPWIQSFMRAHSVHMRNRTATHGDVRAGAPRAYDLGGLQRVHSHGNMPLHEVGQGSHNSCPHIPHEPPQVGPGGSLLPTRCRRPQGACCAEGCTLPGPPPADGPAAAAARRCRAGSNAEGTAARGGGRGRVGAPRRGVRRGAAPAAPAPRGAGSTGAAGAAAAAAVLQPGSAGAGRRRRQHGPAGAAVRALPGTPPARPPGPPAGAPRRMSVACVRIASAQRTPPASPRELPGLALGCGARGMNVCPPAAECVSSVRLYHLVSAPPCWHL